MAESSQSSSTVAIRRGGNLCPVCGKDTIFKCCEGGKGMCTMLRCSDKVDCNTVLDYRRRIGTTQWQTPVVKGVRGTLRLKFNTFLKGWFARPDGDGVPGTQGYRS